MLYSTRKIKGHTPWACKVVNCLTLDQHAHVNCLYELLLAKNNHIIIDVFNVDEIIDTINAIATG